MKTILNKTILFGAFVAALLIGSTGCEKSRTEGDSVVIADDLYEINYTDKGGIQAFVMYSDVGEWQLLPTYEEDWDWVDAYPKRGTDDARFSVKVSENDTAYPRTCDLHIVAGGKIRATITLNQTGGAPEMKVLYSSDTKVVSSLGESFKIKVNANIDWTVEMPDDAPWLTPAEHTDDYQVFDVAKSDTPSDRFATVTFTAIGTSIKHPLTIKQVKPSETFDSARRVTIAELQDLMIAGGGTITDNVYIVGSVVSDCTCGNFPAARMYVQDESNKGICIEFEDDDSNDYPLDARLTIHMLGQKAVIDSETHAPVFTDFSRTMVMKSEEGYPATPIRVADISTIGDYEHCLVEVEDVEYVVPYGTYLNINETALNSDYGTYDISPSLPFSERNNEYVQLLRDRNGNIAQLYTFHTFIHRASRMIPEGSGNIKGVVVRNTKYYKDIYQIRMRSLTDDCTSDDASTRHSKTIMQIGPWTEYSKGLSKATACIGTGQLKESATGESVAVNNKAGSTSMYFQPAWTRSRAAELVGGKWIPIYANSVDVIYYCIVAQDWWQNNFNRILDCDGVAWIITASTEGAEGQLSLDVASCSSSSGPLNYIVEYADDENAPIGEWKEAGRIIMANASTSAAMKLYSVDLPAECNNRANLVLRLRVADSRRAKNTSTPIDNAGTNRLGIIRISSR